ncbi:hypothetical protein QO002_005289 [Pararhizobium capsulatum DSM 1112]|uniref:Uncharacterized protein n=1 Tax=Pararhizobium capsulatum DSM 1112 TaxID=1121113 RepID=A0ABU0BXT6_9HYPH|nr:hypothetical protein [Pararhizobium capsulatum]MDQ0323083.1 hypothetical protein [Pararhizobium capsulatum DSM 1112]
MADSDNSRTLPTVTWDDVQSLLAVDLPTFEMLATSCNGAFTDPALLAWRQWCVSWQRLSEATLLQQLLEKSYISAGSPRLNAANGSVPIATPRQYSDALEAEDRASILEEWAADALWNTQAASIVGVSAKLLAVASKWAPSPVSLEEPWPQIRSVITDLLNIKQAQGASHLPAPGSQPAPQKS